MADEAIHKMETVPPPEGEDDAYNAATKIGPMAHGLIAALMAKAQAEENSSLPPPVSMTRGLSIPKPAAVPAVRVAAPPTTSPRAPGVQRMYDEADDGNVFDPTALFGPAAGDPALAGRTLALPAGARSVIEELDGRRMASGPTRSQADWTKAPTLMAISVVPLPTPPLAPLLEPATVARRQSTFAIEVAIFVGAFLLVAIPAALAYLRWFR